MKNDSYEAIADRNRRRAWQVVDELNLVKIWEAAGARVNSVGRLRPDCSPSTSTSTFTSIPSRPCSRAALPPWPASRKTPPSGESNASTCCTRTRSASSGTHGTRPRRRALAIEMSTSKRVRLRRLFRALRPTAAKGADAGNAAGRPAAQVRDSRPRENLRSGNLPRGRAGRGPDPCPSWSVGERSTADPASRNGCPEGGTSG